jgi:hypothetical protein
MVLDGGEAVGDGDGGAAQLSLLQRLLHHLLALCVQGGRGLVQQQDRWIPAQNKMNIWKTISSDIAPIKNNMFLRKKTSVVEPRHFYYAKCKKKKNDEVTPLVRT